MRPGAIAVLTAWALLIALAASVVGARQAWPAESVDAAIVFVVDSSSSVSVSERRTARQAHAYALASGPVLEGIAQGRARRIAVSYIEFGDMAQVIVDWTIIDGQTAAVTVANAIMSASNDVGYTTQISHGLRLALRQLEALPWPSEKLVVDVMGDGADRRPVEDLSAARDALVAAGATINALPLVIAPDGSPEALTIYYRRYVMGGLGAFTMPVDRIEELPAALRRKLVLELF